MSETTTEVEKRCEECKCNRPLASFRPDKRYKDDLSPTCRTCEAIQSRIGEETSEPLAKTGPQRLAINDPDTNGAHPPDVIPIRADVNPGYKHRVRPYERSRDKVALVGFTKHRERALLLDRSEFEIWGINELYRFMPADVFTRWFEIHPREDLEIGEEGAKHMHDLGKLAMPVYMHQPFEDIPPSCRFPKQEIENAVQDDYFTSSPAWMMGMAIAMGFSEIHIYGVDMAQDTEYAEQRNCLEYWLGWARGHGIKCYVPDESDLLGAIGQYGFGHEGGLFYKKVVERLGWLHDQDNQRLQLLRNLQAEYDSKSAALKADFDEKFGAVAAERNQILGGIQDCDYWKRSWAVKTSAPVTGAVPDRTQDPRTGISPAGQPHDE